VPPVPPTRRAVVPPTHRDDHPERRFAERPARARAYGNPARAYGNPVRLGQDVIDALDERHTRHYGQRLPRRSGAEPFGISGSRDALL
jgi:hypothetical protein